MIRYKEQFFDGKAVAACESSGKPITWEQCHVDHEGPNTFERLVVECFGTPIPNIEVIESGILWTIKDEQTKTHWQEFHRKNAKLRCVDATHHLLEIHG